MKLPVIALCFALALAAQPKKVSWYDHAVIYEIYPRSFQDSNGDGIGDLNGITSRLDYLKDLGVDAIWITPFFPSPNIDFGYDVSDYKAVSPEYGTMQDWDRLTGEARKRHPRAGRFRRQSHFRSAPLVQRIPLIDRQSEAGLVHLEIRRRSRSAADALDVHLRRLHVDLGRENQAMVLPHLFAAAA